MIKFFSESMEQVNGTPVIRSTRNSIGVDLISPRTILVQPGEIKVIPLNLYWSAPPGVWAEMREKSGLAMMGLQVLGGIIDADYNPRNHDQEKYKDFMWKVMLFNVSTVDIIVMPGHKLTQIILHPDNVSFEDVNVVNDIMELDCYPDMKDRTGGHGSTGSMVKAGLKCEK